MDFIDLLVKVRNQKKVSQGELARKCGVTQQAFSAYERRITDMPPDIAYKAAKTLESTRLVAEYDFQYGVSIFKVPVLKNVDDHHMVVCYRLIKEFEEGKEAAIKLINIIENKSNKDFSKADWDDIYEQEIQIVDTYACVNMHIITMEEKFKSFSREKLERIQNDRLKMKGYY